MREREKKKSEREREDQNMALLYFILLCSFISVLTFEEAINANARDSRRSQSEWRNGT